MYLLSLNKLTYNLYLTEVKSTIFLQSINSVVAIIQLAYNYFDEH